MNETLERRRLELQLSRVRLAREELELNILEREADIERLQASVKQQKDCEEKLMKQLAGTIEKEK